MTTFPESIKKRFGTVWTHPDVVELTVNESLKFFKGDLNTATFCDPATGDGRFLVNIYRKLFKSSLVPDPVERSLSILRRLYGVEILDVMVEEARANLLAEHVNDAGDDSGVAAEIVGRNIVHGNTLRTEGDAWELAPMEGGLTPEWFRELKFDIICGNPPYTQYKSSKGTDLPVPIRYPQINMAASFWQWCVEHAINVYGLNVTSSILDGDSAVRREHYDHIRAVVNTELTKTYSTTSGGDLPTIIMVCNQNDGGGLTYNGVIVSDKSRLRKGRFMRATEYQTPNYRSTSVATIAGPLVGGRGAGTIEWKNTLAYDTGTTDCYIALCFRVIGVKGRNEQYKFLATTDPDTFIASCKIGAAGKAYVRYFKTTNRESGLFLWCFLNSTIHLLNELPKYGKGRRADLKWPTFEINAIDFALLQVPDLDYYKAAKPREYQAVLDFAEAHIKSNDVKSYCAGVDKVINDLLGDRPV